MDKDALKGKSLAQLREIGRSMGIKAQLRKQDLIDRIVALSSADNTPTEPTTPSVSERKQTAPAEPKRRGRRPRTETPIQLGQSTQTDDSPLPVPMSVAPIIRL